MAAISHMNTLDIRTAMVVTPRPHSNGSNGPIKNPFHFMLFLVVDIFRKRTDAADNLSNVLTIHYIFVDETHVPVNSGAGSREIKIHS